MDMFAMAVVSFKNQSDLRVTKHIMIFSYWIWTKKGIAFIQGVGRGIRSLEQNLVTH
jgi:hypothetical protein